MECVPRDVLLATRTKAIWHAIDCRDEDAIAKFVELEPTPLFAIARLDRDTAAMRAYARTPLQDSTDSISTNWVLASVPMVVTSASPSTTATMTTTTNQLPSRTKENTKSSDADAPCDTVARQRMLFAIIAALAIVAIVGLIIALLSVANNTTTTTNNDSDGRNDNNINEDNNGSHEHTARTRDSNARSSLWYRRAISRDQNNNDDESRAYAHLMSASLGT